MAKVNYGIAGIRQRHYRVWMAFENAGTGEYNFVTAVDALDEMFTNIYRENPRYDFAKEKFDTFKEYAYHVGEMRADSIDVSVQDGDSIEGNEIGKTVLGKSGTFSAELINSTPEIVDFLTGLDGHECVVLLEEVSDVRLKSYNGAMLETHEIIVIGNMPAILAGLTDNVGGSFHFSEKVTGKNIAISMLNVERSVSTVREFRSIEDFRYEEPNDAVELASVIIDGNFMGEFSFAHATNTEITNLKIEVSVDDADFNNIVSTSYAAPDEIAFTLDIDESLGECFFFRMSGLNSNGVQKTPYSNVRSAR
jgi:hypothetical protein